MSTSSIYSKIFDCVGADVCALSCCENRMFFLSEKEYCLLKKEIDTPLTPLLKLAFEKVLGGTDKKHAFIRMNPNNKKCWMLGRVGGKCKLYEKDFMPNACRTFPLVSTDESLSIYSSSCPEVVRILWEEKQNLARRISLPVLGSNSSCENSVEDLMFFCIDNVILSNNYTINQKIKIVFFLFDQLNSFSGLERPDLAESIINDLMTLVSIGDSALCFAGSSLNREVHAIFVLKLLQLRFERGFENEHYQKVLNEISDSFSLSNTSIPLEERALASIHLIDDGLMDLQSKLSFYSPMFFENIMINHWLSYSKLQKNNKNIRNILLEFLLVYLLLRFLLAGLSRGIANNPEEIFVVAVASFHREWLDSQELITAAAMSMTDSEYCSKFSSILGLLGDF